MSRTGVVTVTYGSPHLLDDHLAAVAFPPDTFVVVVDNFSSAANREQVAARCADHGWEFVPVADNPGFGAACNRGAAVAFEHGCDVVVLLNPDASATTEVFEALARSCRDDPFSMAAPALRKLDGRPATGWNGLDLTRGRNQRRDGFDGARAGDWLGATCLAVGRPLWEAAGGFDEGYFMYWEDVDFSRRVQEAGGRLVPRADLEARHDGGATHRAGATKKSPLYIAMNCRNRLRYAALHEPRAVRWRWIAHTPRESLRIAERTGRRQLLRHPALVWAMVTGSAAGIATAVRGVR